MGIGPLSASPSAGATAVPQPPQFRSPPEAPHRAAAHAQFATAAGPRPPQPHAQSAPAGGPRAASVSSTSRRRPPAAGVHPVRLLGLPEAARRAVTALLAPVWTSVGRGSAAAPQGLVVRGGHPSGMPPLRSVVRRLFLPAHRALGAGRVYCYADGVAVLVDETSVLPKLFAAFRAFGSALVPLGADDLPEAARLALYMLRQGPKIAVWQDAWSRKTLRGIYNTGADPGRLRFGRGHRHLGKRR